MTSRRKSRRRADPAHADHRGSRGPAFEPGPAATPACSTGLSTDRDLRAGSRPSAGAARRELLVQTAWKRPHQGMISRMRIQPYIVWFSPCSRRAHEPRSGRRGIEAGDGAAAGVGAQQAEQDADGCGLARAVEAEKAEDRAARHAEVHAGEYRLAAEGFFRPLTSMMKSFALAGCCVHGPVRRFIDQVCVFHSFAALALAEFESVDPAAGAIRPRERRTLRLCAASASNSRRSVSF